MKEIATALARAQANMKTADKSSVNPHFKSKYADLAEVWDACREALTTEGLSVVQLVQRSPEGPYLRTILLHSSGESIESETPLFLPQVASMQNLGSAVTYAKRISLMAIAGISVGEADDDGEENRRSIESAETDKKKAAGEFREMVGQLQGVIKSAGLSDKLMAFAQRECQRLKVTGNAFLKECVENKVQFLADYANYLNTGE